MRYVAALALTAASLTAVVASGANPPWRFGLGAVTTTPTSRVEVPVTVSGPRAFTSLVQSFSYDPSRLGFVGVIADVATASDRLAASVRDGVLTVRETGRVRSLAVPTTLYDLTFVARSSAPASSRVTLRSTTVARTSVRGGSVATVVTGPSWTNLGPVSINTGPGLHADQSGVVADLAVAPSDPSTLYLASGQSPPVAGPGGYPGVRGQGGLYKSVDGGLTWSFASTGLRYTDVTAVVVNPTNANDVVIEVEGPQPLSGAIEVSTNGGTTWQVSANVGGYGLQLVGSTLYATTFHALLASDDFGVSWRVVHRFSDVVTASDVSSDATLIDVGLWAASPSYQSGVNSRSATVEVSANGGVTFSPSLVVPSSTYPNPSISQIALDGSTTYVVTSSPYPGRENGNPSLYESSDGGSTWTMMDTVARGLPLGVPVQVLALDPVTPGTLYVGVNGGLYVSHDAGQSFSLVPNFFFDVRRIIFSPPTYSSMYVGTDQGLYRSDNRGASFSALNNRPGTLIYDVAVDGSRIMTTVQDMSPVTSPDGGATWGIYQLGEIGVVAVDPYDSRTVVLWTEPHVTGFLWVSHDGGATWSVPSIDQTALESTAIFANSAIAFGPGGALYLAGGAGVMASADAGATWRLLAGSPSDTFALAVDPADPSTLYATNWYGVYESSDAGATWVKTSATALNSLAIDPADPSIIAGVRYLPSANPATFGMTLDATVMVSTDAGATFRPTPMTAVDYFSSFPQVTYLKAATPVLVFTSQRGVYASLDAGATWVDVNANLPSHAVTALTLDETGAAYIATYGTGVWTMPDFVATVRQLAAAEG